MLNPHLCEQGLDPASRRALWEVVKQRKPGRGLILTTHSMEEAEVLCDRLGIYVDGRLVCIGNPKEITSRFAGYLVFTITVPQVRCVGEKFEQSWEVWEACVCALATPRKSRRASPGTWCLPSSCRRCVVWKESVNVLRNVWEVCVHW